MEFISIQSYIISYFLIIIKRKIITSICDCISTVSWKYYIVFCILSKPPIKYLFTSVSPYRFIVIKLHNNIIYKISLLRYIYSLGFIILQQIIKSYFCSH
nr:MAG TPA: hypothetical protein [Crassvirales sp.]